MLLHKLPNNIKGIIFDDVGIIKMIEDVKIEKILMKHLDYREGVIYE